MKSFLLRISMALVATLGIAVLSAQAQDQQPSTSTPSATAPAQQPSTSTPSTPTASQSQSDMSQSQDAKPFSGTIVKEKGKLVLKDSATNMSYQLDDQDKVKQYEGKQVKVTGKLDSTSNQIHVENIEGPTS